MNYNYIWFAEEDCFENEHICLKSKKNKQEDVVSIHMYIKKDIEVLTDFFDNHYKKNTEIEIDLKTEYIDIYDNCKYMYTIKIVC